MENNDSLSVVIPAYNEARRLPATLSAVARYLDSSASGAYEIIIVDDGSKDETALAARAFAATRKNVRFLRQPENRGKGYALRRGVLAAEGEYVLCTDADLSTPIEEIEKLSACVMRGGYDIAIGSRKVAGSVVARPLHRRVLSWASGTTIRLVLALPFEDTQCGFKLYRREAAHALFKPLSVERFGFDYEILARAGNAGLRVAEVGVRWTHSEFTTVRTRDIVETFFDVFRVRFGLTTA